jgi:hypothetical protein
VVVAFFTEKVEQHISLGNSRYLNFEEVYFLAIGNEVFRALINTGIMTASGQHLREDMATVQAVGFGLSTMIIDG